MPLLQKKNVRGMKQDHISCVCVEQQLISSLQPACCCGQGSNISFWSCSGSYHPCYSAIDLVSVAFDLVPDPSDSDSERLPLTVKGEFIAVTSVHCMSHPPELVSHLPYGARKPEDNNKKVPTPTAIIPHAMLLTIEQALTSI